MQTKLTLRIEDALIGQAKDYARQTGKSLSQIVADFFALLGRQDDRGKSGEKPKLPPVTRSLDGLLADSGLDEEAYRRHLEEKHL